MAMTEDWLAGCGPMPSEKSAPPPRLVPDRPPLLARLRCLGTLLQQLNAQTACAAVNEAIEALQDAAATPAEAPGEGGGGLRAGLRQVRKASSSRVRTRSPKH